MSKLRAIAKALVPAVKSGSRRVFELVAIAAIFGLLSLLFILPDFPAQTLPADWDPECAQFEGEWTTIKMPQSGFGNSLRVMRVAEAGNAVWLARRNVVAPGRPPIGMSTVYERWTLATWQPQAVSHAFDEYISVLTFTDDALVASVDSSGPTMARFCWLDWDTLATKHELTIAWPAEHADNPSAKAHIPAFQPQADGSVTGVLTVRAVNNSSVQFRNWWFASTPAGGMRTEPIALSDALYWRNAPLYTPQVLRGRQSASAVSQAIDPRTGLAVPNPELPDDPTAEIAYQELHPPLQLPQGHLRRPQGGGTSSLLTFEIVRTAPAMLIPDRLRGRALGNQVWAAFCWMRLRYWEKRWGEEQVGTIRANATRLHATVLRDPRRPEESVVLDPAFATSLLPADALLHKSPVPGTMVRTQDDSNPAMYGIRLMPLDESRIVITQRIPSVPESLSADGALWRIGILQRTDGSIDWLGWVPLKFDVRDLRLSREEFARCGDQLVVWRDGEYQTPRSNYQGRHRDFQAITIPLPPELADLPAGWPRD